MQNNEIDLGLLLKSVIKDVNKIDKELIKLALTHKSIKIDSRDSTPDNERLEYLGDAVLKLSVSRWLFINYPQFDEGVMSQTRAYVVSDKTLARIARKMDLGEYIILGKKEALSGGKDKESILANALEALFGAIYLSVGFEQVAEIIINLTESELREAITGKAEEENAKDWLQKMTQARFKILPEYESSLLEGPPHKATFQSHLKILDKKYYGKGLSKKEAEQNAAKAALKDLKDER